MNRMKPTSQLPGDRELDRLIKYVMQVWLHELRHFVAISCAVVVTKLQSELTADPSRHS